MYGLGATPAAPYAGTLSQAQVGRLILALAELAHVYFHAKWKGDEGRAAIALKLWKEFFQAYSQDIIKVVRSRNAAAADALAAQVARMTPTATMDAGTAQALTFLEDFYFGAPLVFQALGRILLGQDTLTTVPQWFQTKYESLFAGQYNIPQTDEYRRANAVRALHVETAGLAQGGLEDAYRNYVRTELDTFGIRVVQPVQPATTPVTPGTSLPPVIRPQPQQSAPITFAPETITASVTPLWVKIAAGVTIVGLVSGLSYFAYTKLKTRKRR